MNIDGKKRKRSFTLALSKKEFAELAELSQESGVPVSGLLRAGGLAYGRAAADMAGAARKAAERAGETACPAARAEAAWAAAPVDNAPLEEKILGRTVREFLDNYAEAGKLSTFIDTLTAIYGLLLFDCADMHSREEWRMMAGLYDDPDNPPPPPADEPPELLSYGSRIISRMRDINRQGSSENPIFTEEEIEETALLEMNAPPVFTRRNMEELLDAYRDDPVQLHRRMGVVSAAISGTAVSGKSYGAIFVRKALGLDPDVPSVPPPAPRPGLPPQDGPWRHLAEHLLHINEGVGEQVFSRREIRQASFWGLGLPPPPEEK